MEGFSLVKTPWKQEEELREQPVIGYDGCDTVVLKILRSVHSCFVFVNISSQSS